MTGPPEDFSRRRLDDADFSGARLHAPNFEGTRVTDGWFRDADLSGDLTGLVVNGVAIAPLVEAELDRLHPGRALLRADDPDGLCEAWQLVEGEWASRLARAEALDPSLLEVRVDGEWSLTETLRHLVMAQDSWHSRMIRGEPRPYHPWGLAGSWLADPASFGIDPTAAPTYAEVLPVRRARAHAVAETIAALDARELDRVCEPPDAPGHPTSPHTVRACVHVILDEEWWHGRYADRDLEILAGAPG